MNKVLLAIFLMFVLSPPALAKKKVEKTDPEITGLNKEWDVDVKLIQKLAKKQKCKEVIMYREVLPFFGRENTLKASKEITVQFEKEDLASGRAMILHEKSKCDDLLGNFLVMCTTDTALCYFKEPRTVKKDKKVVKKKTKKTMKAKKNKTAKKQ
ncbi:MAG: hypothetical protein GY927_25310 [bacterium]|nr:hypothetical protein [bacterium]